MKKSKYRKNVNMVIFSNSIGSPLSHLFSVLNPPSISKMGEISPFNDHLRELIIIRILFSFGLFPQSVHRAMKPLSIILILIENKKNG